MWSDVDICVCGEECVYALDWRTSELYQEILLELGFSSIHPSSYPTLTMSGSLGHRSLFRLLFGQNGMHPGQIVILSQG